MLAEIDGPVADGVADTGDDRGHAAIVDFASEEVKLVERVEDRLEWQCRLECSRGFGAVVERLCWNLEAVRLQSQSG